MFGNSRLNRRIDSLQNELDELRRYTSKLTNDVNVFASNTNQQLILLGARIAKLEEK